MLVDDNVWFRVRVKMMLDTQPDLNVTAEASDGEEALRLFENFRPDILISDLEMPHKNGFQLLSQLCKQFPGTKCIVLSAYGSKNYLKRAVKAGARAYVLKDSCGEDLLPAIRTVMAEGTFFSAQLENLASEFMGTEGTDAN